MSLKKKRRREVKSEQELLLLRVLGAASLSVDDDGAFLHCCRGRRRWKLTVGGNDRCLVGVSGRKQKVRVVKALAAFVGAALVVLSEFGLAASRRVGRRGGP